MEKLTLEHLAPYLPYSPKVQTEDGIYDVEGWSNDIGIMLKTTDYGFNAVPACKLVLRPISNMQGDDLIDLFKIAYIDVYKSASTFDELDNFNFHGWDENNFGLVVFDDQLEYGFSMDFEREKDFRMSYRHKGACYANSFLRIDKLKLFTKLFSWHFDVFGLIDKGLAISVHDVKGGFKCINY